MARPRRITREQLRAVRAWKPASEFAREHGWKTLPELAADLGITPALAEFARHHPYKQPPPEESRE
jgi:hypothetical protein